MKSIKAFILLVALSMGIDQVVVAGNNNEKDDPSIESINPDIGHQGTVLTVSISGQNTNFTQGTNMIWFQQGTSTIYAYDIVPESDDTLNATFYLPNNKIGYFNVNGSNSVVGDFLPLQNGFLIKGPAYLSGITPDQGMAGTEINVEISGVNTSFASADELMVALIKNYDTIYLTANPVTESILNASVLIPYTANSGYYNLYVFNNYDGDLYLYSIFNIDANPVYPEIVSVAPDSLLVDGVSQVTIYCQNTHFNDDNNTEVWLSKGSEVIDASSITVNNELQLIVSINTYDAETGYWDINVKNDDDGQFIFSQGITIYEVSGINENSSILSLNVYPNPCFGSVNISGEFLNNELVLIRVIDINGREVIRKSEKPENLKSYSLSLSGLNNGFYVIQFLNKDGVASKRILKVSGN